MTDENRIGKAGKKIIIPLVTAAAVLLAAASVFTVKHVRSKMRLDILDGILQSEDYGSLPDVLADAGGGKSEKLCLDRIQGKSEELIADGEYQSVLKLCDVLDSTGTDGINTDEIRKAAADALKDEGSFAQAKELYALAGGEDAEENMLLCDYETADTYLQQGDFLTALQQFEAIGSFSDSEEKTKACKEEIYQQAAALLYRCDFMPAKDLFSVLNGYKDSDSKAEYCLKREEIRNDPPGKPPVWAREATKVFPNGALYSDGRGELYLPNEINEETRSLVYFAGGISGDYLYVKGLYQYLKTYNPNAVMYFFHNSGFFTMKSNFSHAMELLEEAAEYKNFVVHDIVTVGSSHGSYPAIKAAAKFYSDYGFPVTSVVSLDAGEYFCLSESEDAYFLDEEDYDAIAEAGTEIFLFEEPGMSQTADDNNYISKMRSRGTPVYVIECREGSHDRISVNAYKYGLFSWSVREYENLDTDEYTIFEVK